MLTQIFFDQQELYNTCGKRSFTKIYSQTEGLRWYGVKVTKEEREFAENDLLHQKNQLFT
jgi:hypothetical protein